MISRSSLMYSFEDHLQAVYFRQHDVDEDSICALLQQFREMGQLSFGPLMPAFYIIDYTRQAYISMSEGSKSATGLPPELFLESGLELLFDIYHKEDFRVYNEQIFGFNKDFLAAQPAASRQQFIFNYTFRIDTRQAGPVHLYQRGSYITDSEGLPLYSLGMAMNISGFAHERVMFHSVEQIKDGAVQTVARHYFYPQEEDTLLSEREREIAGYMADGCSIKQIAAIMKIAENTVANHRKNMMRKTGTKNMAELIAFVVKRYRL